MTREEIWKDCFRRYKQKKKEALEYKSYSIHKRMNFKKLYKSYMAEKCRFNKKFIS